MDCIILNPANGKESELHKKFQEIFQDDMAAEVAYAKVIGPTFKKRFGDWEYAYKNPTAEDLEKIGRVNEKTGEPLLQEDYDNGMWFFIDKNGDRDYIDKYKFSDFTAQEVNEVTNHLLHRFVLEGGPKSFNHYDPSELEEGKIMASIKRSIAAYRESIVGRENEEELTRRVNLVEKNKKDFKYNLITAIGALGIKVRENITDAQGNPITDVAEEDKGGGVNIKDSFETNSKVSATVNTKIMLHQLKDLDMDENGDLFEIQDGFLEIPSFANFDHVWNTLNKILVDNVGYGHGESVVDIYAVMRNKMLAHAGTSPWINSLINNLDRWENDSKQSYKVNEFVQAFSKTHLNFYVTQTDNGDYTVINATNTNSRQSQLTSKWNNIFFDRFTVDNRLTESNKVALRKIYKSINNIHSELKADAKLAGRDADALFDAIFEHGSAFISELNKLGIVDVYPEDLNRMIVMNGGDSKMFQTIDDLFEATKFMIEKVGKGDSLETADGARVNVFKDQSRVLAFAEAVGMREDDMAEASVLLAKGKTAYAYSNPTYVSNKINEWRSDPSSLEALSMEVGKENSQWIDYLLAKDLIREGVSNEKVELERQNRLDKFKSGLDSSFKSKGKNDGVDNTEITTNDQINANITQLLNEKLGGKSLFPTIIAADKSRRILFEGLPMEEFSFSLDENGEMMIDENATDIAYGYFIDEYRRMQRVNRENSDDTVEKVVHYHGENGNGMKSQIFPNFNKDNTDPKYAELRSLLYGEAFESDKDRFPEITSEQEAEIKKHIEQDLKDRIQEHLDVIKNLDGLNKKLEKAYESKLNLAGNYFMNGLVSSVEYTKLFSGDPAYYKNTADLIKRIPATYTDGLQLRIKNGDNLIFNQATVNGVEVSSRYLDKIKASLTDKSIADAYERVNTTDAQAWITPRRWRFLKDKLGQWGPQHDKVYEKMWTGEAMTPEEMKLAAQPLKGVYFEINHGRPVYLKYSQAVLIPSLVKGTPMEGLLNKMQGKTTVKKNGTVSFEVAPQDEIHEVVTIDGIKAGAVEPTSINVEGTTDMLPEEDIVLNPKQLSNRGWKLQQDLPIKLMHDTNVGSQIQKNILQGLNLTGDYFVNGDKMSGSDLLQSIHNTVSKLSNIGKQELIDELGIDTSGNMTDKQFIYKALIEEFKDRGGNENIVEALQKGMPFDSIPQIRGKVESIFMSIMNKRLTKISTEGGSFIQVSPFGLETVGSKPFEQTKEYEKLKKIRKDFNEDFSSALDRYSDEIQMGEALFENLVPEGIWNDGIINPNTGKATPINTQKVFGKSEEDMTKEVRSKFVSWFNENAKREASVQEIILNGKKVDISNPSTPEQKMGAIVKGLFDKSSPVIKKYVSSKEGLGRAMLKNLNAKGKGSYKYSDEIDDSGITIVSEDYNGIALLPPRIEKGKVLPGQAMIPHSQALKILKKHNISLHDKDVKSAMALLDPSALELITYRIPNQGMSSNDYLQIVGVLPPGVGDSIVVYDGLPAKTGSDFDIDKLFAMQNHVVFDPEVGKLTKLTKENTHLMVRKEAYRDKEGVLHEAVPYTEAEIEKMLTQNELVAQYKAVLNSPLTYDSMMRSIDGAQLKDDIVGNPKKGIKPLFPQPKMGNMEMFSPLTQLKVKSEYISGKFGVGQTANQLVDHVINQSLDIRLNFYLGVGNSRMENVGGKEKMVTFFDTATQDSHSIADNLSAFLNAYVDIAKDPYIARANHNSITANTTFMLLRAGAELKWVNRFIGQPILKELTDLMFEQQSITASAVEIEGARASAMEQLLEKYGFNPIPQNLVSAKDVETLTESKLENNIKGERDLNLDYQILKAWSFLSDKARHFNKGVTAAKSDTAGAGGSVIDMIVNENKIQEVLDDGVLVNYQSKFDGTMLGTYRENTLRWVRDVIRGSELFIAGTQDARNAFDKISFLTANGQRLTDPELGKSIDNNYYSYMMSGTELFKNVNARYNEILTNVPNQVLKMQEEQAESWDKNFLIEELEIEERQGIKYMGINNKNKPTHYQNKIYRAWAKLYESYYTLENGRVDRTRIHPYKKLAIELVRYSFLTSGFQNNLAQFFTNIPHQILKDNNLSGEIRNQIREQLMSSDDIFIDQYMRHNSDNPKVVKSLKVADMEGNSFGFAYKPAKHKSQEFGSVIVKNGKETRIFPKFVNGKVKKFSQLTQRSYTVSHLFEKKGYVKREDADGRMIKVPVYVRTFKLGSKSGKYKTFEYSKGNILTSSKIADNNLSSAVIQNSNEFLSNLQSLEVKKGRTLIDLRDEEIDQAMIEEMDKVAQSNMSVVRDNFDTIIEDLKIPCK